MKGTRSNRLHILLAAVLVAALAKQTGATTTVAVGTDTTKQVLKGTLVTPEKTLAGEVVIEGDTISCAAAKCGHPPGATVFIVDGGYILPGFIDAHNHVAYNVLPKWTPPKLYKNRGEWQSSKEYKAFKAPHYELKKNLFCEMVKYGEMRALMSGVTTIQGALPSRKCFRTLIRNADNQNGLQLKTGHVYTFFFDIKNFGRLPDWSVTKSLLVHLAEGIDEISRQEFATLKQMHLLRSETAIIHGIALGQPEFRQMAQVGAKLIWSPRSNLTLYGATARADVARREGVPVSLGVDWYPTGSDTVFDELRVAAQVNRSQFGGAIPDAEWLTMVTLNPAKALALDAYIGRLAPGMKADVIVLTSHAPDPNRSLLESGLPDVEMVWVDGDLLYGDRVVVDKVKPGQCEAIEVHGSSKAICVKDTKHRVKKSTQTKAEIEGALRASFPNLSPLVR